MVNLVSYTITLYLYYLSVDWAWFLHFFNNLKNTYKYIYIHVYTLYKCITVYVHFLYSCNSSSVKNQENHVYMVYNNINKTCPITFSCSFWVKPLVALPAELWPIKLMALTLGSCRLSMLVISSTLSLYCEKIMIRVVCSFCSLPLPIWQKI